MIRATPVLQALLILVVSLFAPLFVLLALPFAKWDDAETPGSYGLWPTVRGDLPGWARWLETPDERLPGGLYEPTLRDMLATHGKFITSLYWLGLRNRAHGFAALFAKPATVVQFNLPQSLGFTDLGDGLWLYVKRFGPLVFMCGYRVYALPDHTFTAVPCCTAKLR